MLPQVYWMVICDKEIDKILAGGGGAPFAFPPAPKVRGTLSSEIIKILCSRCHHCLTHFYTGFLQFR